MTTSSDSSIHFRIQCRKLSSCMAAIATHLAAEDELHRHLRPHLQDQEPCRRLRGFAGIHRQIKSYEVGYRPKADPLLQSNALALQLISK